VNAMKALATSGRTARRFGLVVTACVMFAVAPAATSIAAVTASGSGAGTIYGVVSDGTKPLANASIALTGTPDSGKSVVASIHTNARGEYSVGGLAAGSTWSYELSTRFDGALFTTGGVNVNAGQRKKLNLAVYPTTTSSAQIRLAAYQIWIDYSGNNIAVEQDMQVTNKGKSAYVTPHLVLVDNQTTPTAITLPLSANASQLQYLGQFGTCCSLNDATSWWNTNPFVPGNTSGTLRYTAPIPRSVSFAMPFETTAVEILVPASVQVTVPGFKSSGTQSDSGKTYQVFRASNLAVGSVVSVMLGKPATNWAGLGWLAGIGAFAALVLIAAVVWWVRRRTTSAAPRSTQPAPTKAPTPKPAAKKQPKPKPTPPSGPTKAPKPQARATSATWDDIADQLARLDLAFENGGITDVATYESLREGLVQRLMAVEPPATE
jgi:Carboxypeptidase regulatory-like domain